MPGVYFVKRDRSDREDEDRGISPIGKHACGTMDKLRIGIEVRDPRDDSVPAKIMRRGLAQTDRLLPLDPLLAGSERSVDLCCALQRILLNVR